MPIAFRGHNKTPILVTKTKSFGLEQIWKILCLRWGSIWGSAGQRRVARGRGWGGDVLRLG